MTILDAVKTEIERGIFDENVYFVFSTEIASETWAEWAVLNTKKKAFSRERFVSWDHFKGENQVDPSTPSTCSPTGEKQSIPALLRKIFVENLMEENASSNEPIFKSIINPEYRKNSSSFSNWIASILPSMKSWKEKHEAVYGEGAFSDDEDKDFFTLYSRYDDFLKNDPKTHKEREVELFEPAWEAKNLFTGDKKYVVFFPEILDDYADYKEFFDNKNENIKVINIKNFDDGKKKIKADFFTNPKTEIKKLALEILRIRDASTPSTCSGTGARWDEIAVNISDIENYLPYVTREFEKYAIPYKVRSGNKLTQKSAGSIFTDVLNCKNENFSYGAMRELLTNSYVPWIDESLNLALVKFGSEKKCLCNYEGVSDIWKESLKEAQGEERISRYYDNVKEFVDALFDAKSFRDVQRVWFKWREKLFDFERISDDDKNNLTLSHCLDKLNELVAIEEKFDVAVSSPFKFFCEVLEGGIYMAQQPGSGVSIFKYKTSATAFFKYQFVIDASQKSLTVENKQFSFLNSTKREKLRLFDDDSASENFILLYAKTSGIDGGEAIFSVAENSLSGFVIPHSRFEVEKANDDLSRFEKYDAFYFGSGKGKGTGKTVYEKQKPISLENWKLRKEAIEKGGDENEKPSDELKGAINAHYFTKKERDGTEIELEKPKISPTAMETYFSCKRRWLFSRVLKVEGDDLTTSLFDSFDVGNLYHKILEGFFNEYKKKDSPLPTTELTGDFGEDENVVFEEVLKIVGDVAENLSFINNEKKSLIMKDALKSQSGAIAEIMMDVLHAFCTSEDEGKHTGGFGGWKVFSVEENFWDDEKSDDYILNGNCDLILCNPRNDTFAIIDHKSGNAPAVKDCILNGDDEETLEMLNRGKLPPLKKFQIPFYVTVFKDTKKEYAENLDKALYFKIKDALKGEKFMSYILKQPTLTKTNKKDSRDKTETVEEFENFTIKYVFEKYLDEYAKGLFEKSDFTPGESVDKNIECVRCSYKWVCRK